MVPIDNIFQEFELLVLSAIDLLNCEKVSLAIVTTITTTIMIIIIIIIIMFLFNLAELRP